MRAVMISIQPKWCELIANGKKTIEVRRTRPKLEMPFKCYIYCTNDKKNYFFSEEHHENYSIPNVGNGKVIGEFVCERIDRIGKRGMENNFDYCYLSLNEFGNDDIEVEITDIKKSCISKTELKAYGSFAECVYGWHIKNLVIYDTPKKLGKYVVPAYGHGCVNEGKCRECIFFDSGNGYNVEDDCNAHFCTDDYKPMRRPPQSWCYVEEICI